MKGINNLTKWDSVIEWFDDKKYLSFPERTKEELKKFRRISNYIKTLNHTIQKSEKEIKKLQIGITKRKEGIRKHKNNGNELYEKLVDLKEKNEITVYYSEGIHKKKLRGNSWSVGPSIKEYPQTNLKYKLKNTKYPKSINLKPTRKETIEFLKVTCPKWYKEKGKELISMNWSIDSNKKRIQNLMIGLFEPLVSEIVNNRKNKQLNSKSKSIKFEDLMKLMRNKNL